MSTTTVSWFAELTGRMITDIGPKCPDCESGEFGMWVYLLPTVSDWAIAFKSRNGNATLAAQCVCCHRLECFDALEKYCDTVQSLRSHHSGCRDMPNGIYSAVKGSK